MASSDSRGSAAQPPPSSRRVPGGPEPYPGRAGFGELSRVALPAVFREGECSLPAFTFAHYVAAPPLFRGRGSSFSTARCSWGDALCPAKICRAGEMGSWPLRRYPDAGSPSASQMIGEGLPNRFLQIRTGGVASPSPFSLMFWGRESRFPSLWPLEFNGAHTPPSIHMPRGSPLEETRRTGPSAVWSLPLDPSNPRKPSSRRSDLHLGVFAFHLASHPTLGGPFSYSFHGCLSGEILEPASNPQDYLKIPTSGQAPGPLVRTYLPKPPLFPTLSQASSVLTQLSAPHSTPSLPTVGVDAFM